MAIFKTHHFEVEVKNLKDTINIIPIGDVHQDTRSFCKRRWNRMVEAEMSPVPKNTYFLGTGDWNDMVSESERKKILNNALHESTMNYMDKSNIGNCDEFLEKLAPTIKPKDNRWIGVGSGNHHWPFTSGDWDGTTSDQYYASQLGCEYLEDLYYIILTVRCGNRKMEVHIVGCHGRAGGKLAGTTLNQVDDLRKIFPFADIYIMGHDHRRAAIPMSCLDVIMCKGKAIMREKTQWLCRSGSFKRAYVVGQDNYEVGKYHPNSIGYIKLIIGIDRCRQGGQDTLAPDIKVLY